MSFLARLSARARPQISAMPLLMPKGLVARYAGAVYREEASAEEEELAPKRAMRARAVRRREPEAQEEGEAEMARAAAPEETDEQPAEEMQPLRRTTGLETGAPNEEEAVQAVRRATPSAGPGAEEEEAVQAVRRATPPAGPGAEEEEAVQAVRRATPPAGPGAEEEEAVQAVRRSTPPAGPGAEGEEEVRPGRPIRRAEEVPLDDTARPLRQPFQSELGPGATPPHPELAREEEPSDFRALRRDTVPQLAAHGTAEGPGRAAQGSIVPEGVAPFNPGFGDRSKGMGTGAYFEADGDPAFAPPRTVGASAERPQVIIDQLDVLIHEPAPSSPAARLAADGGRMLRARYLRRL